MVNKIVLATGGFDPLHSGHIDYLKEASLLGNALIVGVNSDEWLIRKKGRYFLEWNERVSIIKELKFVSKVISFDDSDDTANDAIRLVLNKKQFDAKLVFANGGDRINDTTPELKLWANRPDIEFKFGVGGFEKKNSSSRILNRWLNYENIC